MCMAIVFCSIYITAGYIDNARKPILILTASILIATASIPIAIASILIAINYNNANSTRKTINSNLKYRKMHQTYETFANNLLAALTPYIHSIMFLSILRCLTTDASLNDEETHIRRMGMSNSPILLICGGETNNESMYLRTRAATHRVEEFRDRVRMDVVVLAPINFRATPPEYPSIDDHRGYYY